MVSVPSCPCPTQIDGNFVVKNAAAEPLFSSGPWGEGIAPYTIEVGVARLTDRKKVEKVMSKQALQEIS
jgi:hypothetical protein